MLRGDGSNSAAARLQILSPLGAGGFGAVYEAIDTRSGQRVAVKELDDTSADSVARFKREFRALADCHHQNLVGLLELIEQDGRWLIVMELVPGTDFLRYVRQADNDNASDGVVRYDEARLRGALIGMVEGLRALHAFGIVHRDLKPSNVRVRPDGRAVLLDFGLVTSVDPKHQSTHAMGVGTVVYMAPEQAGGQSIGPAVDLYALGACLFEALTGRAAFEGDHSFKILMEKQRLVPPRAASLVPGVPADLDALCARLLEIDPAERPSLDEVLSVLTQQPQTVSRKPGRASLPEEFFAGRESELTLLERALARTHQGELRVVLVEGESGVGKSELVSEFLRRSQQGQAKLVSLRGRCYENEQVSYKAFDGCIDELSKVLRRLPEPECSALLPTDAALLGQLFPVLRNVKAIAKAPREGSSADPTARRLEAFTALAHLFSKLAEERPVVLVLDDLQWADAESFRLLAALAEQSPRPPILLIGTVRPREELEPDMRERLEEVRKWPHTEQVSLLGLPREHAKALARRLLSPDAPEAWLDMIVSESQGHPLFMSELQKYAQSHDFAMRGKLTLEAALFARIERLDSRARALLELVAIAARPYASAVFANALSVNIDEAVRSLLRDKLLKQRKGQELGCFHDRIRHAAVSLIAPSRLPALHYQFAAALAKASALDPSEQARHWDLANQPERASIAYEAAADKAFHVLAFSRAAQLCERAIELAETPFDQRVQRLTIQRADALACAGRSADAAELYQQAADSATGEARIQLRSRAAKHLILGAKIGRGFAAARELLQELGFSVPLGTGAGLLRYFWDAACLRLRGFGHAALSPAIEQRERVAVSVVGELLDALTQVHPLAFFVVSMQYVRRALRLDSKLESAFALTRRAWSLALRGGLTPALPLIEQSRRLMENVHDKDALARYASQVGLAHIGAMDWTGAAPDLERAESIAQQHCAHNPQLLATIRHNLGSTWFYLGEHARLAQSAERWLHEARERNDVLAFAMLNGMGFGYVRHLMRDAPEPALAELEQMIATILPEPYSFPHLGFCMGSMFSLLYRGGPSALRFLNEHEAKYGRAFLLRGSTIREGALLGRLVAVLSAYAATPAPERAPLLKEAKRVAHKLRHARSALGQARLSLSLAQLEAVEGRRDRALSHAQIARARFRELKLGHELPARYIEGLLEGGLSGQAKCETALAELRNQGWQNPARAIGMHAPLYALLSRQKPETKKPRVQLLLDRYEVSEQLGRGGFGSVVSARDVRTGRTVALKELVRSGGMSLERFKQEFRALTELHHEHIVQIEELFEHHGTWYIAMERIDGTDLVSHVRASGSCDALRLRQAFAGLARGLAALHETGFVHRDVKPDNVVVTPDGRAVLIDFGLIARVGDAREVSPVGSAECAAPEQLLGATPDAAADVYALGSCLYAALSGRLPFAADSQAGLVQLKQQALPQLASLKGFEDITRLCKLMLAPNPALRPTLDDVVDMLSESPRGERESVRSSLVRSGLEETSHEVAFAGRELELSRLQKAYQSSEDGLSIVLIEGESGLGKSALARDFARRSQRRVPGLRVFQSRCYENEQVAFKAFDGAVDQLAQFLRSLQELECQLLLPKRAALLAQLFPVLSSVPAIADAPKKGLPADPAARKQAGSACFIELLEKLTTRCAMMFMIDDLQWADSESFELLRAFAKRGTSLPLLFVATVRPAAELEAQVATELSSLQALPNTQLIGLDTLDPAASLALARQLLGAELPLDRLEALVRESKGHPLFLRELVEHERSGLGARKQALTLDDALGARIDGLPTDARALLELVALADKPYGSHVYARAMDRPELPREALVALLKQGLLRRRADKLTCYHDCVRRVTTARLSAEPRRRAAGRLALALSRDLRVDAAERARLWDEAGEPAQALDAYEQAGDQALEALAFLRAEQHYARALALLGDVPTNPRWQKLMVARGHSLVRAGRSAEAARSFQRAAEHAAGEEKVRLRMWAAQHLIQGAHVDEGMRAASALLLELGVSLPRTEGAAKGRIVWERARVKLRGVKLSHGKSSPHEALVLEALHGLTSPVRAVSILHGSALVVQYLRRALNAGDPRHAARALSSEALWRSLNAPAADHDALFDQSLTLAEATCEPALIAEVHLMRGVACIARNQTVNAPAHLKRAHELVVSQCPGHPWLLTTVRMYLGSAWYYSCNFREIRQHAGGWLEEARVREDRYAVAALSGFGAASWRHVLDDDPDAALAEIETAMAPWPSEPLSTTHMGAFFMTNSVHNACSDGVRYLRHLEQQRARLERSFLMRTPTPLLMWRNAIAVAQIRRIESLDMPDAMQIVAEARAAQRAVARLPGRGAASMNDSLEACFQLLAGDRGAALNSLRSAHEALKGSALPYEAGLKYAIGVLEGGENGKQMCAEVLALIRAEGFRDVRRGLRFRLPGSLELLEG